MGIMNRGVVYGLWDYEVEAEDELSFREGDCMTILRREDQEETQWWWARCGDKEGYIPRNLLGVSLSVCLCDCCRALLRRGTQREKIHSCIHCSVQQNIKIATGRLVKT